MTTSTNLTTYMIPPTWRAPPIENIPHLACEACLIGGEGTVVREDGRPESAT